MGKRTVDRFLFGAAYYDEYMPKDLDRIDTDMAMMNHIGINVIRIAESTWSTCEPQPGVFDFSHVDRALDSAHRHGINVIVGTPTYAVPTWLVRMHPDVLAVTPDGPGKYGPRQIMDIVNGSYRYYAERVIRRLIAHVADYPAVIGYQVDNETKYYDCVSQDMQTLFVKYLRGKFHGDLDMLNAHFGLDYWSNRINAWEDFPDVANTINQSLRGEFDRFRRAQVTEFLDWQASIVREYARDDQFVTQNFDFGWKDGSYGVQPAVDHFTAARTLDIAGCDIYHPTQDDLTGKEIAFGGDLTRSLKDGANYLVLETEAQGNHGWLPFPGQMRLQAYSHLASGADMVEYWHWHSIHNSFETYWKGLLSHDLEPNPTYEEAGVFGREIARPEIGERLLHLRKRNRVAIMVSNEALSALEGFHIGTGNKWGNGTADYNDVVRRIYDALFELNVECDVLPADAPAERLASYAVIVTPALYCASDETITRLREYVANGGHLISTLRSFVADEETTVWHDRAPHRLTDVFGMSYNQFTPPKGRVPVVFGGGTGVVGADGAGVAGALAGVPDAPADTLIELLKPNDDARFAAGDGFGGVAGGTIDGGAGCETAVDGMAAAISTDPGTVDGTDGDDAAGSSATQVLAHYGHYAWAECAAITRHAFGKGTAEWIGTVLDPDTTRAVMREALDVAGVATLCVTAVVGTTAGDADADAEDAGAEDVVPADACGCTTASGDAAVEPSGTVAPAAITVRQGVNARGETVTYLLNYSADPVTFASPVAGEVVVAPKIIAVNGLVDEPATAALTLHEGDAVAAGDALTMPRWNLTVIAG
ncbi:beta-galactosidase [Bifidobacterium ramosum]|uniref:beta-galactosidase n=2 Tax=Bifidobacterium ramosum TaxID=1798158 RepID=A0A6L4X1H6_9BIFI|nr:alpha-amylase family protein [Bifidobacterium ramosum]KAB8288749.1 beta-galactosidase [Bifidobacterium ramosum]